jgi:hypothetical protein
MYLTLKVFVNQLFKNVMELQGLKKVQNEVKRLLKK